MATVFSAIRQTGSSVDVAGRGPSEISRTRRLKRGGLAFWFGAACSMTLGACQVTDRRMGGGHMGDGHMDDDGAWSATASHRTGATPRTGTAGSAGVANDITSGSSKRRHVIIMIGDGMQMAHEVAASRYLYGTDYGLAFHSFPRRTYKSTWDLDVYNARAAALGVAEYSPDNFNPVVGYDPSIGGKAPYPVVADTDESRAYFLNGIAPDSASTASAMSTGVTIRSHAVAWWPDEARGAIDTGPGLLRRTYGMAIGFVTTVPFSHATPAGFFAHNTLRDNTRDIAREMMADTRPDVMIGGGWLNENYYDTSDLDQLVASNAYLLVHREVGIDGNLAVLAGAARANQAGKKLFGIFGEGGDAGSSGNFPSPVPVDNPGNPKVNRGSLESPTLESASVAALEVLARDPDGFFLMIEQGDIDWANHNHDFARMIGCMSDLDAAVRAVVAFVDRPGDAVDWSNTTLLVTADHANSFMRFVTPLGAGDLPAQNGSDYPDGEITYGWSGHTSELTTVYLKGFAAASIHNYETDYAGLGIIHDTAIYRFTLNAARR